MGIWKSNVVCDVMLTSDSLTDKCGIIARGFGSCRLLKSIYPALGTNSEAPVLLGMQEHQMGLE